MLVLMRLLLLLALICFGLTLDGEEALKTKDIPTIMQQIFDQHVSQKGMTAKTLKNSFMVYINQFDPNRIYLLESEVAPYRDLSDSTANKTLQEYQSENFQAFTSLNNAIQKAILRARAMRKEIGQNARPLFLMVDMGSNSELRKNFAKTPEALKERIRGQIVTFIHEEQDKFGMGAVLENQSHVLSQLERSLQEKENRYLYVGEGGKMISSADAENLFALHLLKAMTGSLDSHSAFYNASEANDLKMKLQKKFEGLGISLEERPDGKIQVSEVVKDSPAYKSQQVERNDILLGIDGLSIQNKAFDAVLNALQNGAQKDVRLRLQRQGGQPFDVVLNRMEMTIQDDRVKTTYQNVEGGIIGVITLDSFYQSEGQVTSENDVKAAILKLQKKGHLKGVILDLRENSGGFLIQAGRTAGLFMSNGVVVISKYFNGEEQVFRDLDGKKYYDGPLVILTSRITASAAEIVTQALQDYGIALVVGDTETYGKGTIQNQTVTKAQGASLFKVTVGRYYTPSGKTPQLNGVKADIFVPGALNYERIGEKFLPSTIPADTIPESFNDRLSDLTTLQQQWFIRHYLPTLEKKQMRWKSMLPELKARSAQRISLNKGYQKYIRELQVSKGREAVSESMDFQLLEAVNIVKDMIFLSYPSPVQEAISGDLSPISK